MKAGPTTGAADLGQRTGLVWWLAAGAVVLLGFGLRVAYYWEGYGHPDESITVEVVGQMRRSGDWDTNWAKAPNLASDFRYDQYNFSSHLYATYFFYRAVKLIPGTQEWRERESGFWVYRFFSVLLATAAVGLTLWLAWRAGGSGVALLAGGLVAVSVQLVQDAHYSRPEAFVTALTLAAVGLCWPAERLRGAHLTGGAFLVGVLVACKVSMLMLAWLPMVPLLAALEGRRRLGWGAVALGALAAGFVCGAPGAVTHPRVFLHGIAQLMGQYSGVHPPHSHLGGGMVADFLGAYYAATLGWLGLLGGVVGGVVLMRQRRWAVLALLAGPVLLFGGYFATRGVFFERNLSHILPLFLILAAVGVMAAAEWATRRVGGRLAGWAGLGLLVLALPALRYTWPLVTVEYSGVGARRHEAFEVELRARHAMAEWREVGLLNEDPLRAMAAEIAAGGPPLLVRVTDFRDEWTAFNLGMFEVRFEAKLVAEYPSTFSGLPVCTLYTYNSPHDRYFLVTGLRGP